MTSLGDAAGSTAPALGRASVASVVDLKVHFSSKAGIVKAVDGVSFDIADGETLGLVGETGCGKSVTARSFLRLNPMPPGIQAGGSILFRPHRMCDSCHGIGCSVCDSSGRLPVRCPNCQGAGCSTCAESGQLTVDLLSISERDLRTIRGNRIAMIFQDPGKALNPALSIREQLAEVFYQHRSEDLLEAANLDGDVGSLMRRKASLRSRRLEDALFALPPLRSKRNRLRAAVDSRIADALAETQIPNPRKVMDRYPHELSGGMRQRVMIAQALACGPDLLIADEPTTALDVTVQARILELVRELQQRHRTSVLYISHDLSLVRKVCDRVAVMYAGRIAEVATTDQIFEEPHHPYTRGLLAAVPAATHERGRLVAIEGNVPELIDPPAACRFAGRCPYEAAACRSHDPMPVALSPDHEVACFIDHPPAGATEQLPSYDREAR
ncbi:MAG: oligopeptide/dipeptide ABC transporter ATP-binding protein [Acidimicrobiia bacterium]